MPPDDPDAMGREFARRFLAKPAIRDRPPDTVALLMEGELGWTDEYRSLPLPDRLRFRSAAERELKRALRGR